MPVCIYPYHAQVYFLVWYLAIPLEWRIFFFLSLYSHSTQGHGEVPVVRFKALLTALGSGPRATQSRPPCLPILREYKRKSGVEKLVVYVKRYRS